MALALLIFAVIFLISGLLFRILGELAIAILGSILLLDGFVLLIVVLLSLIF